MDIFTTMITPYKPDGSVDYETALRYVDWYFENGLTGIFAVCQSSEIFFLSLEERVKLNQCVYERHVIHAALQDMENISTHSTGTEPNRRVVIEYVR